MMLLDNKRKVNPTSFKFLQAAQAWKAAQARSGGGTTTTLFGFVAAAAAAPASGQDETQNSDRQEDKTHDSHSDVASSNGED